jgi:iron complex transport system substrate-binding protein
LNAPARRIVSLAPNATELLFAAGAGERVVGVLSPADWPPEAARLPRVGDARTLDLERIVALKPDLAVAWPYASPAQVERLRSMGIPVYISDPRTPEAIADDIERLGVLSGSAETAARAAAHSVRASWHCASASAPWNGFACSTRSGTSRCTPSAAGT